MSELKIGFVGLGDQGAPMAEAISDAGFELHVWAWRDNPQGPFVDWNDHVSCAGQ